MLIRLPCKPKNVNLRPIQCYIRIMRNNHDQINSSLQLLLRQLQYVIPG